MVVQRINIKQESRVSSHSIHISFKIIHIVPISLFPLLDHMETMILDELYNYTHFTYLYTCINVMGFMFQGFYRGGKFIFSFKVGPNYPHEPPKVKCETQVYHPNIDLDGNVCLNILREDWKPVLTINSIVYGLQYLFLVSI